MNSSHPEHNCSFGPAPCDGSAVTDRSTSAMRPSSLSRACLLAAGLLLSATPAIALDEGGPSGLPLAQTSETQTAPAASPSSRGMSQDPLTNAQESFEHPVKYAIYSPAWHLSSNAGLRIMAHNRSAETVELASILFRDETGNNGDVELSLRMTIPAGGWAELQLPYQNLLTGNDCVDRTLEEDWRLVEISNYTLNPSVRGLIIENTRSFRIYQCVRSVRVSWQNLDDNQRLETTQWLMYHFERLPLF